MERRPWACHQRTDESDFSLSDRWNFVVIFDDDSERKDDVDDVDGDGVDLSLSDRSNLDAIFDADSDRCDGDADRFVDGDSLRSLPEEGDFSNRLILSLAPPLVWNTFFFLSRAGEEEDVFFSSSFSLFLSFLTLSFTDVVSLDFISCCILSFLSFLISLLLVVSLTLFRSGFLAIGGDFLAGLGVTIGSVLGSSFSGFGASGFGASGFSSISGFGS